MANRVFIDDLTPITDVLGDSNILVDQSGYKKIIYNDFVIDIVDTIRNNHNELWNAQIIDGSDVKIELPQNGEVIEYNDTNSRFENDFITSQDIIWSGIDVNEHKFLQVNSSGDVVQTNITIPSLRMDNTFSGGFFLRVKNDGTEQITNEEILWRNNELYCTDVFMLSDYPLTFLKRYKIKKYRKKLRNWPEHSMFPNKHYRPVFPL